MTQAPIITLLTHKKEFGKRSNTGQIVTEVLGPLAEALSWDRMVPDARLLANIAAGQVALVYPGSAHDEGQDLSQFKQFVVIDGTWLTARRIHHRSPYLHQLPRVSLRTDGKSVYNLRQNQKENGLCTAEAVVALLRQMGRDDEAERLYARFLTFIKPAAVFAAELRGQSPLQDS